MQDPTHAHTRAHTHVKIHIRTHTHTFAPRTLGNFKLGVRFLIWKIYPMEVGNTLMNAFLVNTWIILLCSVPTVQFCAIAFPEYAALTEIDMIFGTQIQYLEFLSYFWQNNVFIYAILALNGLTLIWLLIQPRDVAAEVERELDALANEKEGLVN